VHERNVAAWLQGDNLTTLGAETDVVVNGGPRPLNNDKRTHIVRAYPEEPGTLEVIGEPQDYKDGKKYKCSQQLTKCVEYQCWHNVWIDRIMCGAPVLAE
jgi:hypothetical protein